MNSLQMNAFISVSLFEDPQFTFQNRLINSRTHLD